MKDISFNQALLHISDPAVAKVLTDTREWPFLSVFLEEDSTLSQAAEKLGMSLPALSYRVRKLLKLGLLKVTRVEQRKGSPIKHYQLAAQHFFVPFKVTPSETLESLLSASNELFDKRLRQEMARVFLEQAGDWGLNIYRDNGGGFSFTYSPVPERDEAFVLRSLKRNFPAVFDLLLFIELDFDTAKAFQRDMYELCQRYIQMETPNQQVYLLRMNLVPVAKH